MRDNDGRKLDHKTLEALRIRAVERVGEGAHPDGPGPAADAVRVRPVDPEMIREVIRREFGVALSVVSVGRLLAKLGLSPQRPLHRAYQQDPEAVERWKREAYPAIRAEAEAAGAVICFADEAGVRSDYHAGTTWSPVGKTPVVKNTGSRFAVNMISAVSAKGALRFAVYEGTTNAATFIDFCKQLLHDAAGPVYLIVDGHPAHRATATREFAASTGGRLRLIFLPGYSPELNPD